MDTINQWLTATEVAKKLMIGKNEVYRLIHTGELKAKKLSKHRTRVSEVEVERFMQEREDVT